MIEIWGCFGPLDECSKALMPANKVHLRVNALGKTLTNRTDAITRSLVLYLTVTSARNNVSCERTTRNLASRTMWADKGSTHPGANLQTNKEGRPTFCLPGSTEPIALITPARRETNYSWRMLPRGRRGHPCMAGLFPLALGAKRRPEKT